AVNDRLFVRDLAQLDAIAIPVTPSPQGLQEPIFSPDGTSIAFLSTGGVADWLREEQIYTVPVSGGTPRPFDPAYGRTPDPFLRWRADGLWFSGPTGLTSQIFRGPQQFSRYDGVIENVDARGDTLAFVMQSLTAPPEIYVSSTRGFEPRQITHHNDALREKQIASTKLITWKNPKDGLEIEGLLTLPIGYTPGKRVPLLTFVHGGPASHHEETFVGYLGYLYPVNVFAEHGFAVLRPNPRGTGGYGEKFREANRNDWGGMDWMDINAGIDKLIAGGIADPNRLGMMGWSYGGFMTAWAEGHSDRLKAISIGAPVVDLFSFHGTTDIRAFIPNYFQSKQWLDLLRERSPLWHLKPSTAKILIQQDDGDERVPLSQGTMLYRALQELGVDVTMVIYHSRGHTPQVPQERIDVMQRNVDLFGSVIGERPSRPQPGVSPGD
ncbi:MAG TPA: alpha/beta fold hydrolase, partial [Thermoanaerobaculia bacterium]